MQNQNICAQEIFYHNSHLPHRSAKKVFANSLNTFEDIAFLLGRCKGKIEIFRFLYVGKFLTLLLQNQNICAQEIFNHNSHLPRLKISCAQIFWFCNSNVRNFPTYRNLKISISLYTVRAEMLYLQKNLRISKTFFGWENVEGGYCGWKFLVNRDFGFAIATLQLSKSRNVKFNFSLYTVPREMLYLKSILKHFEKHFFGWKMRRWLFWLIISSAQRFWVCNSNVTTFPKSRKCKNFNFFL